MFNFNNTKHDTALDKNISDLLEELDALNGNTEEYTKTATNLAKLMELRDKAIKTRNESTKIENDNVKAEKEYLIQKEKIEIEKDRLHLDKENLQLDHDKLQLDEEKFNADQETRRSWKPSPDAIVGAAASVIGILFILHYEKLGVVTSKAVGFVGKMK